MSIYVRDASGPRRLDPDAYASERALEDVVAEQPYLLLEPGEPALTLVARQVHLPGTGIADLLFVDAAGLITLAEVKLARNGEARREVVAQVFDYVATLADHTFNELAERTGGQLEATLQTIAADGMYDYEALRRSCSASLEAGRVRVAVVMDAAPDGLARLMGFLNAHSDLDVRLVTVERHASPSQEVYVPRALVVSPPGKEIDRATRVMPPNLAEAIAAFDERRPHGLTTMPGASSKQYRQVRVPGWPSSLHYEFVAGTTPTAEVHPEFKNDASFAPLFEQLRPAVEAAVPSARVMVSATRWKGQGALIVRMADNAPPGELAAAMEGLIGATKSALEAELRRRGHLGASEPADAP